MAGSFTIVRCGRVAGADRLIVGRFLASFFFFFFFFLFFSFLLFFSVSSLSPFLTFLLFLNIIIVSAN